MTIILPVHNIRMIEFSGIMKADIESKILDDLHSFNLIKGDLINIKHKDVKRIMYHHIIYELCVHVLAIKGKEQIIIYHDTSLLPTRQINMFTDEDSLIEAINNIIQKIIKMLPVKFLCTNIPFKEFKHAAKLKEGLYHDILNNAKDILSNYDISKYTFTSARGFAKRHGLEYLSNNFFQKIKTKQLLLR
jgi:hypothetical protein